MIECVLSSDTHAVTVPKPKRPDRIPDPKGTMITLFRKLAGKTYVDREFAKRFAKCLVALNRLRKCKTFQRFEARVLGQT